MQNPTIIRKFLSALLLATTALLAAVPSFADEKQSPLRPVREPGAGLLYYAKAEYASADNRRVIANPYITGAFFQVIWSEVEKKDGECDWREVDSWVKPWLDVGKKVAIRVMWSTSGAWRMSYYKTPTPGWVWKKGAVFAFHPGTGTEIPLIWDPVYKKYAWRFLEQFAARYGDNPNLLFVDVTPGAETNPYRFGTINRTDPGFKDSYEKIKASDGRTYTEELWLDSVKEWIDASDRIFKNTPLLVTLNVGGLRGGSRLTTIGGYAAGKGFYVGQNGLGGNSYRDADGGNTAAFLGWAKQSKLFFEMVQKSGGRTGTLMEVMQAAERIQCSYLNVYPEDVLMGTKGEKDYDPRFEAALKYGAELMSRRAGASAPAVAAAVAAAPASKPSEAAGTEPQRPRGNTGPGGRPRGQRAERPAGSPAPNRQVVAPAGVKYLPDLAYREGNPMWKLDLAMPEAKSAQPRPAIVFIHGGGWRGGDKRSGYFLDGALEYATKGYVCVSLNYRLIQEAPFPACVEDVRCAVRWLRAHAKEYNVDPDRIGGYGNSAGAHLVAMLALAGPNPVLDGDAPYREFSSLLQAACVSATPTDFTVARGGPAGSFTGPGQLLAGPADTAEDRIRQASPVFYARADAPPFLIIHGTADNTVKPEQADRLVNALKAAGAREVGFLKFEGAGHDVFVKHADQTKPAMEKFFATALAPRTPSP